MVFFDDNLKNLDIFLASSMKSRTSPISDIASVIIPTCREFAQIEFNLVDWRDLITQTKNGGAGMKVLAGFGTAPKLQAIIDKSKGAQKERKFPKNATELSSMLFTLTYEKYETAPEVAEIFARYKIPNTRFERALAFREKLPSTPKDPDNLPQIVVKCDKLGQVHTGKDVEKGEGHYMLKLPPNDPRALILGDITGCC